MFFTRLMFFFALISYCLTSSCFDWLIKKPEPEPDLRPKANPDEVAEFNKIIESEGWKSLTGIFYWRNNEQAKVTPFSSIQLINETDFKTKKEFACRVLSALYENMLMKLISIYEDKILDYYKYDIDYNESTPKYYILVLELHLKYINKSFAMFEPLAICMYNALSYFKNSEFTNLVYLFLGVVKDVMEEMKKEWFDPEKIENVKNVILKKENLIKSNIKRYVVVKNSEDFVENYIKQFENLGGDSNRFMIDPKESGHEKKVQDGVDLFCKNFGFPLQKD